MKKNIKSIFALSLAALLTGCSAKSSSLIACDYYTAQGRCKSIINDIQEFVVDSSEILDLDNITVTSYLCREAIAKDGKPIIRQVQTVTATLDLDQLALKLYVTKDVLPEGGKEEFDVLADTYYFLDPTKGAVLVESDYGTHWELQKTTSELAVLAGANGVDITTYMKHMLQCEFLEIAYERVYSLVYAMSFEDEYDFFTDMSTDFVVGSINYSISADELEMKGSNKNNDYRHENSEGTYKGTNEYDFYLHMNGIIPGDMHAIVTFKGDAHETSTGNDYIGVTETQNMNIKTKKNAKITLPDLDKIPFIEDDD